MLFAQVDLVLSAVEAEADGAGCLSAVEVVDEERLDSLGRYRPDLEALISGTARVMVPGGKYLRIRWPPG